MSRTIKISGYIDRRLQPLVTIEAANGKAFLALVDTGFNSELWCGIELAQELDFVPQNTFRPVSTAGGASQRVEHAEGYIVWFGERRLITAYVTNTEPRISPGQPVALLGNAMIRPGRLLFDFLDEIVTIVR